MSQIREKVPLLTSPTAPQENGLFPPINKNLPEDYHSRTASTSSYGVIEITSTEAETRERKLRQPSGIATAPFIAVIALVVGLVLILTFASTTDTQPTVVDSSSGNLQAALKSTSSKLLSQSAPGTYVDIELPQGWLRGYTKVSRQGREYSAFYKVPYAEAPLGNLRFKDPEPPSPWKGLRDNPVVAPQCIQKEKYAATEHAAGEEDCLYANVYTPRLPQSDDDTKDLFPTMVYVHGGGFTDGNGSRYGADYYMDEDVVIITFQFRLGAFGFLNTGDDVIRGNMGLKDQVQMLKWTRDNVKHFNGDPDRVTIYGNSGGGMCVGLLLTSPMASGLFHRAISQSGAALNMPIPESINDVAAKGTMKEVGKVLGCKTEDSQKYWECLLGKDASDIALVRTPKAIYAMTIEDGEGREESTKFMPEMPYKRLSEGNFNAVPYIAGNTNSEWIGNAVETLQDKNLTESLNERFEEVAASFLQVNLGAEDLKKVKEFYFGTERIWNGTLKNLANMMSDKQMVHGSYLTARLHAKEANTYLYWLTKPPYLSYVEKQVPGFPAKELGFVNHADELQYFFLYDGYPEIPKDDAEYYEYSKYLVKLWVHFARTGNPTMDGVEWRAVNEYGRGYANSTYWLELSDNPSLITTPQQRMGFWDQFTHEQMLYDW